MTPRKRAEPAPKTPAKPAPRARKAAAARTPAKKAASSRPKKTAAATPAPDPAPTMLSVLAETDRAIAAATHLNDMDAGAVAVLRDLARTIDLNKELAPVDADGKWRPMDNVTVPTYLKACEQLGLTPSGRVKIGDPKAKPTGKLGQLRAIRGGEDAGSDAKSSRGGSSGTSRRR